MDHAQAAKRHRDQAAEFRAKAEMLSDEGTRESYIRMAEAYEKIAALEERMADNPTLTMKAAE